jgi:recombinational DNA repair protein RecR
VSQQKKRIFQNIKTYPYFYKICEACDKIVSKESAFCLYCNNYRFKDSIVDVTKRAEELLTLENNPLDFDPWEN